MPPRNFLSMRVSAKLKTFDPGVDGIPETEWSLALLHAVPWTPLPGPIFIISPHPDDEVFGAGGLISMQAGSQAITIISVTDGELAYAGWPTLASVRCAELSHALASLTNSRVNVVRLGLPDGGVARHREDLQAMLRKLLPDAATLVIPFEEDGHPDHNVIGEVASEIGFKLGLEVVQYPIWRWHHGDVAPMTRLKWGKFELSNDARAAKAKAMRCFQSQLAPPNDNPVIPGHVLAYFERSFEAFVL